MIAKCNLCKQKLFHKRGIKLGLCSLCIKGLQPVMYSTHTTIEPFSCYKSTVLFRYDRTAKELIHFFKFRKEVAQAKTITALMLESFNINNDPEVIIPVPSHPIDEIKRGFSHMAYIAFLFSKQTGLNFDMVLARKLFPLFKRSQKRKSKKQRIKNKSRFYLRKDSSVAGKNILLIDDVMTTGNTVKECAKVLLENGAKKVEALCFALTPM